MTAKHSNNQILRMKRMVRIIRFSLALALFCLCACLNAASAEEMAGVPVLGYHRFGPTVADSMTVTTPVFESQLKWLAENQYTVIPLRTLVDFLRGQGPPPPPRSVVITVDDGHQSVYSVMLPLVRKYSIPVTLFIYPSAISNASYAMRWEQLKELKQTGFFDIQSHSYWHPNFHREKKKLPPADYQKLVETQLKKSRSVLEEKSGSKVDILAWPFGIYDEALEKDAEQAGYVAAFSIDHRHAKKSDPMMALPRYLIANGDGTKGFQAIVTGRSSGKAPAGYSR
jgi:peptidoglycan/xylan/chitin deacetylase (PgdA/CDA1 family)